MKTIQVIAYRGEHGPPSDDALQTRSGSITFCNYDAARCYATSPNDRRDTVVAPRIIKAEITIANPFLNETSDPFLDLSRLIPVLGREKTTELAVRFEGHIANTDNWYEIAEEFDRNLTVADFLRDHPADGLERLYAEAYHFLDDPDVINALKAAGYDGAVHGGSGETALESEYRVFDARQARVLEIEYLDLDARQTAYVETRAPEAPQAPRSPTPPVRRMG